MNMSIRRKALYGLAALLFSAAGMSIAQETGRAMAVPAPDCSVGANCIYQKLSVAVTDAAPLGASQFGVISIGGAGVSIQDNVQIIKNEPYQAQAVSEVTQTLADGSHIDQKTTATVARDSEGRTIRIQKLSTIGPWKSVSDSSQTSSTTLTTIFDPVAKTHTDYASDNKVAHVLPMPALPPRGAETGGAAGEFAFFSSGTAGGGASQEVGPVTYAVQGRAESPQSTSDMKSDSLGTKTIEGISVAGTKTTSTIPAGTIGNDKDIIITRETWYSPDLKLVLQSTQTDPRFGETTYSLTNIQRNEPDPTLFQVPAGYTIDKVPVVVHTR